MRTGVVTPEAVVLDLPTAGVATRAFARLADLLLQLVLIVLAGLLAAVLPGSAVLLFLLGAGAVLIVLPIGLETLWRGRSVGKAVFGLRVVGADGAPVRPRQSVVRGLLAVVELYISLGFLAVIAAMFSPRSQRLGDMAGSTVVVRDRRAGHMANPVVFYPPEGYESYVANLDVGRLHPEDFSLIREYLLRVGGFSGDARAAESTELARAVSARIGHQPDFPVDSETWLVCVAAAFQWREGGLLRDVARGVAPVRAPVPSRT